MTLYSTSLCSYKNRFSIFLILARCNAVFPDMKITSIREPAYGYFPDHFNSLIGSYKHCLVSDRNIKDKKLVGNVIDLTSIEPSDENLEGLLSYLTNCFDEYLLTEWFNEDCEVVRFGQDKRRHYELRKEITEKIDLIEIDSWKKRVVINQQKISLG